MFFSVYRFKRLIVCAVLTGLAFGGLGCGSEDAKPAQAAKSPILVTAAPVEIRKVVYTLEQVGSLKASERAMLRAQVAATVSQISFKQGSEAAKGQVLVRLDDAKIKAEIRNLNARIEQLKVRLAFKGKTLKRNQALLKRSAIAQHSYDELATEVQETELAISQVRADLARQKEMLAYTIIRAPFDGVVGSKDISLGDYLKVGDPVVELVVLDPLEIAFQVPERYHNKVYLGQDVSLKVASEGEQRFKGGIIFISPTMDTQTRTFLVKAAIKNPAKKLKPGMFAGVSLVTEVHQKAAVVPWASVIRTEDEAYIYLLEKGLARKVAIEQGKVTEQWAEVLKPLLPPGAKVIVEGKFAAKDGAKVRVRVKGSGPDAPAGKM